MSKLSVAKENIRIVLLEGIHESAISTFHRNGYSNVRCFSGVPQPDELNQVIADAHMVGIRSRTHLSRANLKAAKRLFCIGCFCIGTNQVDLQAAKREHATKKAICQDQMTNPSWRESTKNEVLKRLEVDKQGNATRTRR